jgi:hypothetical protein
VLGLLSPAYCTGSIEPVVAVSPTFPVGDDAQSSENQLLMKKRIVGGDRVEKGEYPFLALTKGRSATTACVFFLLTNIICPVKSVGQH